MRSLGVSIYSRIRARCGGTRRVDERRGDFAGGPPARRASRHGTGSPRSSSTSGASTATSPTSRCRAKLASPLPTRRSRPGQSGRPGDALRQLPQRAREQRGFAGSWCRGLEDAAAIDDLGGTVDGPALPHAQGPDEERRRSPRAIVKHMQEDSLVHWSWEPGGTRESISMPHHVFVEFVEEWLQTGAHCPD